MSLNQRVLDVTARYHPVTWKVRAFVLALREDYLRDLLITARKAIDEVLNDATPPPS